MRAARRGELKRASIGCSLIASDAPCLAVLLAGARRRAVQRRAGRRRLLHALARLRSDPPAHRGQNFDWDSTTFDGRVTTTLVSLRPGLDSSMLDMGRSSRSGRDAGVSARARPCAPLAFAPPRRFARRPAARPAALRRHRALHRRLPRAHPAGTRPLLLQGRPGAPHRPQQVYSGGGTDGNPRWLPTWGGPADKATWELIATVPASSPSCPTGGW